MTRLAMLAALALSTRVALAADPKQAKPSIDVAHTVTFTSTVKSVDQKTRVVTLLGKGGEEVTFTADKRVKNLPQLKVGDVVTVTLEESLKARVLDPGEKPAEGSQSSNLATAPLGAKPAGHATKEMHVVATVAGIDVANMVVTLKNPNGETWQAKARSKANLEKLKVGDVIDIRSKKSLAVDVSSPAPKG